MSSAAHPGHFWQQQAMRWLRGRVFICCWVHRETLIALALGLWLAGYWIAPHGYWQSRKLIMLAPFLVLGTDRILAAVRTVRWLWAVSLLVGWQILSRAWGEPPLGPVGRPDDALRVFLIVAALVVVGRRGGHGVRLIGGLALLSAAVTGYSLVEFYGDPRHGLATDRFRNMLVYSGEGLNPVLTGMLSSCTAVCVGWFALRSGGWKMGLFWTMVLAVMVFGLMGSQSRGAMLGFATGFGVLLWFEWRNCYIVAVSTVFTVAVYFIAVQRANVAYELFERGSAGRFAIYQWHLSRLSWLEVLVGKGFGSSNAIPERELGWFVAHPHSSYLAQLALGGLIGTGLLLFVLSWSIKDSLHLAQLGHSQWAALLACGLVSVLFDGSEIFSFESNAQIEFVLVVLPACLAAGHLSAIQTARVMPRDKYVASQYLHTA
jgi:hypothetical protein